MPTTTDSLFSIETINTLIVEPVYASSVALSSGLNRYQTPATEVYIPSVGFGTAGWTAELAVVPDAGIDSAETPVKPKKVAARQIVSNESADDANAANLIGTSLVNALSASVDQAFFVGAGADGGPAGLPGVTGVSTVAADASTALDPYVDAIAEVEAAGGQAGAIYVSPGTWAALAKLKVDAASAQPVLSPVGDLANATTRSLFGVPVHTCRFVPDATAWVVDPSRVLVIERTPSTVTVDRSRYADQMATMVLASMRLEFAAPIPGVVCHVAAA